MASLTWSGSTRAVSVPLQTTLRHPTPSVSSDGYSPYGSYSRSIMSLEQMAEEMSQGGSDIGEEIRRMNEESKERSRQNSIQSSHQGEYNGVRGGLIRMESSDSRTSSVGNSAVGVNGAARWGGYSPGGYVSSPAGSVHSGSWSHVPAARKASASGSSKLAQMVEPVQEGKPLDSPLAPSVSSYGFPTDHQPSRQASQSSFAQRYDQIANQIEESLVHVPPSPPKHTVPLHTDEDGQYAARQPSGSIQPPDRPRSTDTFREAQVAFKDFDGVHFSPGTEEYVTLDEDGNEIRRVSARHSSGGMSISAASLLRTPRARPLTYAEPPPGENMVYYPAPVPRMLNLPKRLSQLPAASVQAKRRSQVLSQLQPEVRESAPWLPQLDFADSAAPSNRSHRSQNSGSQPAAEHPRPILNERMSVRNLQNLPPQLRASIFFDHESLVQDVDIKSESAVATLDNILAASATAPVSAFTDHPYAGDVRRSVYAPEKMAARRMSTATLGTIARADAETKAKRHSSTIGNLLKRSSSGDKLAEQLQKNGSRSSLLMDFNEGGKKLQKRKSGMSFADDLDAQAQPVRTPGNEISEPDMVSGLIAQAHNAEGVEDEGQEQRIASASRPVSTLRPDESQQIADDFKEAEAQEDLEEGDPVFAQPTTLLAELQVRKANLKSRNRTAVMAYPNGMHSTLLQLDAVKEIQNRKRKQQRVALAWDEPNMPREEADLDDEVPLGVLFPGKEGMVAGKRKVGDGKDWDRPLGLMEKRELEDNEPLRSRRNRLQGLPPGFGRPPSPEKRPGLLPSASQLHLAGQPDAPPEGNAEDEAEDANAGETLGQRVRRLRTKDALDTTISEFAPKQGSRPVSTFTDDVLSQFGGLDVKEKPDDSGKDAAAPAVEKPAEAGAEEEETLGQRKARLQREREASGEQPAQTRPPMLRSGTSLANLLAANPVGGERKASREHKPAQGTLLHASAAKQAKQKAQIMDTNVRSSSYAMDRPLVDAGSSNRPHTARDPAAGGLLAQQMNGMAATGGFAGGMYNNGLGGIGSNAAQQGMQSSASTPMFGMNGANSYFVSPTAFNNTYGHQQGMVGYPQGGVRQAQQPPMMSPMAYQGFAGAAPMAGYGYPATMAAYGYGSPQMPYGMGLAPDEPLDRKQRDAIDRWRASVAQ